MKMNTERLIIDNAKLILPEGMVSQGYIVCEDGVIVGLGDESYQGSEESALIIDAKGNYVSPGFIDIHTHGAGGHDFMDNTIEAYCESAKTHARYGTTSLTPTTLASTKEELVKTLAVYREAKAKNTEGANFLGLHLEGPYFAYEQKGAQDPKYLRNPNPHEYIDLLELGGSDIIRWSIAPELDGAIEMGRELRARKIVVSLAHTNALYEEVVNAYENGYTLVTHLYSCMSTITRRNAFRYAGAIEAAYLIDDMAVEVIADGVHVPKPLLQYVCKFKSHDKIVLCTDSMRGAGMPDGEYLLGSLEKGQKVIVEDGVAKLPDRTAFAGSVATADRLIRTMVNEAGLSIPEAVKMMTQNPACILGLDHTKGSLSIGKDADIVVFDANIHVQHTIVDGKTIYTNNK